MGRETYRCTAPLPTVMSKDSQHDIEIHGVPLPKGSVIALENIGRDEKYFKDAKEFKPERWFPDAVESRKGTREEVVDHPVFRDPFVKVRVVVLGVVLPLMKCMH